MRLRLKVKTADGSEAIVELLPGDIIGRSAVKLQIDDPRASGKHAVFEYSSEKGPRFVDLGSRNLIRTADGKKVRQLHVINNTKFYIGSTEFQVISIDTTKEDSPPSSPAPVAPPSVNVEPETPYDFFISFITRSTSKIKSRPYTLLPFQRLVRLKVTRGLQFDDSWTLGYGPREVGPAAFDLVLHEPGLPDVCFTLTPKGSDVLYETRHPHTVLLNNQPLISEKLRAGDVITMLSTSIEVEFDK